ncbi:uncharacterized protein BDV17DRAFT_252731 [Aspergillus undulatus]|uniref:uncharacterized protein n=1 Tax=Aspergillus undulatus TaxID=1810928 RepID=UPI003CCD2970
MFRSANLASPYSPPRQRPSHTRDHLESLIARHGRPNHFSLSSLEELTATCSTYNPPSPLPRSRSPTADLSDSFGKLSTYHTRSRPIPIPRSPHSSHEEDIPVTPLTGRFERDYFPHHDLQERTRDRDRDTRSRHSRRYSEYRSPILRSENSDFYSSVASQSMSSSGRSGSPQPALSRAQNAAKSAPTFHLGDLPRFHPAVYQYSGNTQAMTGQPPSPRQPRQHVYRATPVASRDPISQYRDFVEGVVLQKPASRPLSPGPSAPRLNPLNSPGPVTPLTLEEAGSYLSAGAGRSELTSRSQHSAPAPDLLDRLIARENERVRQKARRAGKGR